MGDLSSIRIPGKFAARLGQGLSSSTATVDVPKHQQVNIDDITANGFCFSDGVGLISPELAMKVADHL
ncbi:hypothetical protein SARC_11366, partial [Sphaeroforma arctica JP610]